MKINEEILTELIGIDIKKDDLPTLKKAMDLARQDERELMKAEQWISVEEIKDQEGLVKEDYFLWHGSNGFEIHQFHSDAGYGIKTYTDYIETEKTESSLIVNWSGLIGKIIFKKIK